MPNTTTLDLPRAPAGGRLRQLRCRFGAAHSKRATSCASSGVGTRRRGADRRLCGARGVAPWGEHQRARRLLAVRPGPVRRLSVQRGRRRYDWSDGLEHGATAFELVARRAFAWRIRRSLSRRDRRRRRHPSRARNLHADRHAPRRVGPRAGGATRRGLYEQPSRRGRWGTRVGHVR